MPNRKKTIAGLYDRMDFQDEKLISIETQAKLTNGRVTALETANVKRDAFRQGVLMFPNWLMGLLQMGGTAGLIELARYFFH